MTLELFSKRVYGKILNSLYNFCIVRGSLLEIWYALNHEAVIVVFVVVTAEF